MTLQEKLQKISAELSQKIDQETIHSMRQASEEILRTGIMESLPKAGDLAPSFSLNDSAGVLIHSEELLQKGPLILSFYRGVW